MVLWSLWEWIWFRIWASRSESHLLTLRFGASYLDSLCFKFFICKITRIIVPIPKVISDNTCGTLCLINIVELKSYWTLIDAVVLLWQRGPWDPSSLVCDFLDLFCCRLTLPSLYQQKEWRLPLPSFSSTNLSLHRYPGLDMKASAPLQQSSLLLPDT